MVHIGQYVTWYTILILIVASSPSRMSTRRDNEKAYCCDEAMMKRSRTTTRTKTTTRTRTTTFVLLPSREKKKM